MKLPEWMSKLSPTTRAGLGVLALALLAIPILQGVTHSGGCLSEARAKRKKLLTTSPHSVTNQLTVCADFNNDGLEDFVIAEADISGDTTISLYLRRDDTHATMQYAKGGHVDSPYDLSATAMMTVETPEGPELVIILSSRDGGKEVVHYKSAGDELVEVKREHRSK